VKVIFLQDVPPIGHAGDVKEVKDGYGRNFLLPRKLAAPASKDAMARAETLRAAAQDRRAREAADWGSVADALRDKPIVLKMRAGPTGRLYGSVTNTAVAAKLAEIAGRAVDRRGIRLPAPVREVGKSKVHVRLHEGIELDLDLVVEPETPEGENAQGG
jgi:large subunit ribosomal protein L9